MPERKDRGSGREPQKAEPSNSFIERIKRIESSAGDKRTAAWQLSTPAKGAEDAAADGSVAIEPKAGAGEPFLKRLRKQLGGVAQALKAGEPKPETTADGSAQIGAELEHQAKRFAYLLESTYIFLNEPARLWRPYTDKQLAEEWRYALDSGETPSLLEGFEHLCGAEGTSQDALRHWLDYLMKQGFTRGDAETPMLTVALGSQTLYSNAGDFSFGEHAEILKHPWYRNGELVAQGALEDHTEGGVADG